MSANIEQRVVQMVLDKEGFEKGAETTIDTLDRLDSSINNLVKSNGNGHFGLFKNVASGFSDLQKGTRGVITSVEQVANKYSWFEQIAVGAYRKIGEAASTYLKNQVMDITGISSAKTGWGKYESEIEAVQTIMNATGKSMTDVETELKRLAWYTDETSYSYDSMIANIGRFSAAGVTDIHQATTAMMGIANMAGYFGVNASNATHAMEGFAKAMGKGKMDAITWNWVETAKMNSMPIQQAFIDAAVEAKTLKKVGEDAYVSLTGKGKKATFAAKEFKNTLKDGWLTQEVMLRAFGKYGKSIDDIYNKFIELGEEVPTSEILRNYANEFDKTSMEAFHAAQQTKTFSDAVGALKEVAASGWRESFRYIFGNYEEARDMWGSFVEEVWGLFADKGYARNALLGGWYEGGGRDDLLEAISNLWQGIKGFATPIQEAWESIFPPKTVEWLLGITAKFKEFSESFRDFFSVAEPVEDAFEGATEVVTEFIGPVAKTKEVLDQLVDEVWAGKWGDWTDRFNALEEAGYSWQLVQNAVNESANCMKRYEVISDEVYAQQHGITVVTEEQAAAIEEQKVAYEAAAKRAENFRKALEGLFSIFDIVKTLGKEIVGMTGDLIKRLLVGAVPALEGFLNVAGGIGGKLVELRNKLKENPSIIRETITKTFDRAKKDFSGLDKAIKHSGKVIYEWAEKSFKKIGPAWDKYIKSGKASKKIGEVFSTIGKGLKSAYDTISPILQNVGKTIGDFLVKAWKHLKENVDLEKIKNSLTTLWGQVSTIGEKLFDFVMTKGLELATKLKEFLAPLMGMDKDVSWSDFLIGVLDSLIGTFSSFIDMVSGGIGIVGDFFGVFDKKEAKNAKEMADTVGGVTRSLENTSASIDTIVRSDNATKFITFWSDLLDLLTTIADTVKSPWETINKMFNDIFEGAGKMLSGYDINNLGSDIQKGGIGAFLFGLSKVLTEGAGSLASIPGTVNGVLIALEKTLVAYTSNINANTLMTIAKAIGILTLSIIGLCAIKPENLQSVMEPLLTMALTLGIVAKLISPLITALNEWRMGTLAKNMQKDSAELNKSLSDSAKTTAKAITSFGSILIAPLDKFLSSLSFTIDKRINSGNFARSLLGIVTALGILTVIIYVWKKQNWAEEMKTMDSDIWMIIGVLAGMVTLMAILTAIGKSTKGVQSIGTALSYVSLAAAIYFIGETISLLVKNINVRNAKKAALIAVALAMFMMTFAFVIAATSSTTKLIKKEGSKESEKTVTQPIKMVMALLAFVGVLWLAIPVMKQIGELGDGTLIKFGLVVAGMLGALASLIALAKWAGNAAKDGTLQAGAKSLLILTGAAALIMTAITGLTLLMSNTGVGFWSVIGTIALFAGGLAAIVGVAYLLKAVGAAEEMEKLGTSVLKMGVGFGVACIGIAALGMALPTLVEGIMAVGDKISDESTRAKFLNGMVLIIGVIIAAIVLSKTKIFSAMIDFINGGIDALKTNGPKMIKGIADVFKTMAETLNSPGVKTVLIGSALLLIWGLFDFLDSVVPKLVDRLFKLLLIILYTLGDILLERGPDLVGALVGIAANLTGAFFKVIGEIVRSIFGWDWLADKFQEWGDDLHENNQNNIKRLQSEGKEHSDAVDNTSEEVANSYTEAGEHTSASIDAAKKEVNDSIENTTGGDPAGSFLSNLFGGKVDLDNKVGDLLSVIPENVTEQLDFAKISEEGGGQYILDMWKKIAPENYENAKAFAEQGKQGVKDGSEGTAEVYEWNVDSMSDAATKETNETTKAMKDGLEKTKSATETGSKEVANTFINTVNGVKDSSFSSGENATIGFANGVISNRALLRVSGAALQVSRAYMHSLNGKQGLYEQSPSHKTFKSGVYAALGVIKGSNSMLDKVGESGATLGQTAINGIASAISAASSMFTQDLDMTPTITPVIDLDNVQTGIGVMNGLLNSKSLDLATNAGIRISANKAYTQSKQDEALNALNAASSNSSGNYYFETPVVLNGREIARGTAEFTREELNKLDRLNNRKGGKL